MYLWEGQRDTHSARSVDLALECVPERWCLHIRLEAGTGQEASSWIMRHLADQVQWERGRESLVEINKCEEIIG